MTHMWVWGLSIFALIALLSFGRLVLYPYYLTWQRQAVVNSHQYVEARKSAITAHYAQWIESDCGAKRDNPVCRSLTSRMRAESAKIDQAMVTPDIRDILTQIGAN